MPRTTVRRSRSGSGRRGGPVTSGRKLRGDHHLCPRRYRGRPSPARIAPACSACACGFSAGTAGRCASGAAGGSSAGWCRRGDGLPHWGAPDGHPPTHATAAEFHRSGVRGGQAVGPARGRQGLPALLRERAAVSGQYHARPPGALEQAALSGHDPSPAVGPARGRQGPPALLQRGRVQARAPGAPRE